MLYRFDGFELDLARFELRAEGEVRPLEPQVFALLALLIEHRERLVSKDELVEKIWDGRAISEAAISSRIKSARQALGDDGRTQRYIRTTHGRGFRFVGEAEVVRSGARIVSVGEIGADPGSAGAPSGPGSESNVGLPQGSRPSIAVLPFRVIGDAGTHATIAEAIPHELISELSRLRWLFVTARASSFRVGSGERDPREIGRLLGVRYVLSGTFEIAGSRLVVTVELADTRDGGVVWADRQEASVDDVHAIRAEIRARVLAAFEIQIPLHEAARARLAVSEDLDAWSAYHLGLQHMFRFNRADNGAAADLFGRAIALDPQFARAHAGLSFVHFQTAFLRQSDDLAAERRLARDFALRGLDLDPVDPFVNFTLGRSYWLEGDLEGSLPWLDRAIAVCPNYAQGIYARGWTESLSGDALASRAHIDLAMRLSPLDPLHYAMSGTRAFTHIALREDREAADWADRAARSPGAHVLIAMIAVAAHALVGDEARAAEWAGRVRARNDALTRADFFGSFPMRSAEMRARVSDGLARFGF